MNDSHGNVLGVFYFSLFDRGRRRFTALGSNRRGGLRRGLLSRSDRLLLRRIRLLDFFFCLFLYHQTNLCNE